MDVLSTSRASSLVTDCHQSFSVPSASPAVHWDRRACKGIIKAHQSTAWSFCLFVSLRGNMSRRVRRTYGCRFAPLPSEPELIIAIKHGDSKRVDAMIKKGADMNVLEVRDIIVLCHYSILSLSTSTRFCQRRRFDQD